ncbi:undecaprenyl-diphosphatase UppP [Hydrogenivirga sp. 128-5-R1-1]|uniref:undecaprenyl-diphosphatase UppP n=1 Tax=Hydrogenivirga sp. 128-5-R1-1 TaxID=392423 RepID=UPI00015F364A|nr:undecaprenyl-diphosphatase UppP [Hydrogenivirga sp. 128-5-R1-1]EDP76272.1 undecaprenol kinase [Hydrogenivirga sp. 128-5-R1-1]
MEIKDAFILGVVEGLTEFLPVSSTGHLILTAHVLGLPHDEFTKSFEIAIQLGSILAVVFIYFERFIKDYETWKRVILAFIPTGLIGFALYKLIKGYLIGNDLVVVINLFLGGIVLILADRFCERFCYLKDIDELPVKKAPIIGLFQALAVVPGVSRSGATIIGGMLMGLSRRSAAEFSFILAVPTMLMATAYDLFKTGGQFESSQWELLGVGFITAFFTAMVSVKLFLKFLNSHGFTIFGVYRMIVAILYAAAFLL